MVLDGHLLTHKQGQQQQTAAGGRQQAASRWADPAQQQKTEGCRLLPCTLAWSLNLVVPSWAVFLAISALLAVSPMRSIMPPTLEASVGARSNSLNLRLLLPVLSTSTLPRPCKAMVRPDAAASEGVAGVLADLI